MRLSEFEDEGDFAFAKPKLFGDGYDVEAFCGQLQHGRAFSHHSR